MLRLRKLLVLLLVVVLLDLPMGPLHQTVSQADDTAIFSYNIQPNVMILLDTSNSMNDEAPIATKSAYNPGTDYTTQVDSGTTYTGAAVYSGNNCKPNGNLANPYTSISAISSRTRNYAVAVAALQSQGWWSGTLGNKNDCYSMGNYLNYQNTPNTDGMAVKLAVAKQIITTLLSATSGVQFGFATFSDTTANYQKYGGAIIKSPIGTDVATIIPQVNGLATNGSTPIGGALYDLGKYFNGNPNLYKTSPPGPTGYAPGRTDFPTYTSPITYPCAPNYIILVTDGQPNDYTNTDNTPTNQLLSVQAAAALKANTTSTGAAQPILVDTIGFNITGSTSGVTNTTLQAIAAAGGGQFYSAANETALINALRQAMGRIVASTFSYTNPVIPTTSATGTNRAYLASFVSNPSLPFWQGNLSAYTLTSAGQIPTNSQNKPDPAQMAWDAGTKLNAMSPSARTLYTLVDGALTPFTTANITPALLGFTSTTDRDNLVNFIRGSDSYNLFGNGFGAAVPAKLGDIFHSTPVLVRPPYAPSTDPTYATFVAANKNRTTVLLAGANDGMLHAFKEADGTELWGYIPSNLLTKLGLLTDSNNVHPYFVDGSPIVADVKLGGTWKTVAIFGQRAGGNTYTALDITDPTTPKLLWTYTHSKIAETWSEPVIGKVRMDPATQSTEKYVAFVGGGFDSLSNNAHGAAVLAIDIATGTTLWQYYNDGTNDDRKYMNYSIPSNPLALDLDADGYIDHLYIGDVAGQIWKFVFPAATLTNSLVDNWKGKRFFTAPNSKANPPPVGGFLPDQAMYYPPTGALDTTGALWLYVGTGDRNWPTARTAGGTLTRLYGIKDTAPNNTDNGSPLDESSLANVTTTNGTQTRGWYVILSTSEKVLAPGTVLDSIVYFTSFIPSAATSCSSAGGTASLYAVQMNTGYAALNFAQGGPSSTGSTGTGTPLVSTSASATRQEVIGSGIPSKPIVLINDAGGQVSATLLASTTNQEMTRNTVPAVKTLRVLYWTER